ncbi:MAG: PaaI family thioesterase, partial [Candidatus Binataceae bacterium]
MDYRKMLEDQHIPLAEMLGIRFLAAEPQRVTAELPVRAEICTVPAILHGGAIMAFADTLGACATMLNLPK